MWCATNMVSRSVSPYSLIPLSFSFIKIHTGFRYWEKSKFNPICCNSSGPFLTSKFSFIHHLFLFQYWLAFFYTHVHVSEMHNARGNRGPLWKYSSIVAGANISQVHILQNAALSLQKRVLSKATWVICSLNRNHRKRGEMKYLESKLIIIMGKYGISIWAEDR